MNPDDLLDHVPALVYQQELDNTISYGNQVFIGLFGKPGGRKCYQVFHCQEYPCEQCLPCQLVPKGSTASWDYQFPGGQVFRLQAREIQPDSGAAAFVVSGVDITGVRQKEESLALEVERFRTIADFTYDWEYWIGADGRLLYNSPAFERITGRPVESFLADPNLLVEIAHPEDRAAVVQHLQAEASSQDVCALDFRILTPAGEERWISHACQPVYRADGHPLGRRASNRDITERKVADQALLRAERLAAIGRLVASLAHEINNPLQAMYSSIELVMDFPLEAEERQKYLGVVRREIERLRQINASILDFTRTRKAVQQPTSLEEMARNALALAGEQLKQANIKVSLNFARNLPPVVASRDQLVQVCLNLIINSIEQMPDGGWLNVSTRQPNGTIEMSFSDSGTGISSDPIDQIFDPFYTTKKEGTGLGLAVSQNIVQHHGGTLTAHNSPDGGAVFTMSFPARPIGKKTRSRRVR